MQLYRFNCEKCQEKFSHGPADSMYLRFTLCKEVSYIKISNPYPEGIKSVVVSEGMLQTSSVVTHWPGHKADKESSRRVNEAAGRGDGHQA